MQSILFPRRFLIAAATLFFALVCTTLSTNSLLAQDAATLEQWQALQGEYQGEMKEDGETMKVAAQIVAGKDGKFTACFYFGGLPGDGWNRGDEFDSDNEGTIKDGKLIFTPGEESTQRIVVAGGVMKQFDGDELEVEAKRVERESETLGKAPPEGALVLFDGSNGDQFQLQRGEGSPVDGDELRQGIISKEKFAGDFELHLEFKLPFEPNKTGQGRGNSGIYVQGRYEVQMLDSFGLTGEHNECGGIYEIRKPDVNMCYPPEQWQTYDIHFQSAKWDGDKKISNAKMTVHHNGVLIHKDADVPNPTRAAPLKETAEPGYLYFQDHGSPVRYRNIWLLKK